jgi:hypothetical protein
VESIVKRRGKRIRIGNDIYQLVKADSNACYNCDFNVTKNYANPCPTQAVQLGMCQYRPVRWKKLEGLYADMLIMENGDAFKCRGWDLTVTENGDSEGSKK